MKTFLKDSDEKLGRRVRELSDKFKDKEGFESTSTMIGAKLLIGSAIRLNSEKTTLTLEGFTDAGKAWGDWEVTVCKIK